jgi:hypothetical protein
MKVDDNNLWLRLEKINEYSAIVNKQQPLSLLVSEPCDSDIP